MPNHEQTTLPDYTTYYDATLSPIVLAGVLVAAIALVALFILVKRRKV
jgi:LPXTG-motif cell wall-anchored protein